MSRGEAPDGSAWRIPAGVPPAGVTPNFNDPVSIQGPMLGINVTLMSIGTVAALSSIYEHRKGLKMQDYTLFVALVFCVSYTVLVFILSHYYRHQWDIPLGLTLEPYFSKETFAIAFLQSPTIFLAKAAILALYYQIFAVNKTLRALLSMGLLWNILASLPGLIVIPVLCAPSAGQSWGIQAQIKCSRSSVWGVVQSALSTVLDIYLFVLPIPIVARLKISKRKKVGVLVIFGIAFLGIIASIVSLVYRAELMTATDISWYESITGICNLIEIWIAIIVGSVPGFSARLRALAAPYSSHWLIVKTKLSAALSSLGLPIQTAQERLSDNRSTLYNRAGSEEIPVNVERKASQNSFVPSDEQYIVRTVNIEQYEDRKA